MHGQMNVKLVLYLVLL